MPNLFDDLHYDTALYNGTILTMDKSYSRYDGGMILIRGNTIVYVGPYQKDLLMKIPQDQRIDTCRGLIIPGFINTHTHIGMSLFRSLADDTANRLRKVLIPLEQKFVQPELVYWASLHTISEMLLGGTTTFADMYYFAEMTAQAAEESGMRAIVGESVTTAASPDTSGAQGGIDRTEELIRLTKDSKLITAGIAPHAPYSLTKEDLMAAAACSQKYNIPILSHLAEMPFEERYTLEQYDLRPVPFYDTCGLLNERAVMAHCIFADEHDRRILAQRDTGIAHNVSANSKSGKGIAPAYECYTAGMRIGLGTDGPMSGNTMDMVHLLNMTSKFQKVRLQDPTIMKPREVFEMATIGGARALHMEDSIGSLETGKLADITIISTDSPAMFPIYDPYATIVYSASPSDVSLVMVNGKVVMRDRRLITLDTMVIREASEDFVQRIAKEMNPAQSIKLQ